MTCVAAAIGDPVEETPQVRISDLDGRPRVESRETSNVALGGPHMHALGKLRRKGTALRSVDDLVLTHDVLSRAVGGTARQ